MTAFEFFGSVFAVIGAIWLVFYLWLTHVPKPGPNPEDIRARAETERLEMALSQTTSQFPTPEEFADSVLEDYTTACRDQGIKPAHFLLLQQFYIFLVRLYTHENLNTPPPRLP